MAQDWKKHSSVAHSNSNLLSHGPGNQKFNTKVPAEPRSFGNVQGGALLSILVFLAPCRILCLCDHVATWPSPDVSVSALPL